MYEVFLQISITQTYTSFSLLENSDKTYAKSPPHEVIMKYNIVTVIKVAKIIEPSCIIHKLTSFCPWFLKNRF